MQLSFTKYKDQISGCWWGKNIGGVLGAPFEGERQLNHVTFYTQDLKQGVPPNDDLDLQLVWLNAVERFGRGVNADILGEYWLSYILPDWAEYGAAKNNLRRGLVPPLSGSVENAFSESNGCFIRSEIWACLAPGRPEMAVRYAYEDGIVDHSGDGVYAEMFCAAVESAAFVESDARKLIDIGLSYIPAECGVRTGVQVAMAAYDSGKSWEQARRDVLEAVPSTFGVQRRPLKKISKEDLPVGKPGYDAPCNIGLTIIGWLYGGGDFGKSLCIATNCGEDADCTSATLGAILGIIGGVQNIPEKWKAPVGDRISFWCINTLNGGVRIPKSVTELTDRILRQTPLFLREYCDVLNPDGYTVEVLPPEQLYCNNEDTYLFGTCFCNEPEVRIPELLARSVNVVAFPFTAFRAELEYVGGPYIRSGEPKKLRLTIKDSVRLNGVNNQWIRVKWYLPEGVTITPHTEEHFFMKATYRFEQNMEFEVTAENPHGIVELVADISVQGRHSYGLIKVMLLPNPRG